MGKFIVTSTIDLNTVEIGQEFPESDFSVTSKSGKFIQMKYLDESTVVPFEVKPGIFTLNATQLEGMKLETSSFVSDKILDEFVHTEELSTKLARFFSKLDIYKKYGIEVPRRNFLLYGAPGGGKSTAIIKSTCSYAADNETLVILWPTIKFEATHVKDFIKRFQYNGVKRLILVAEDIGGVEMDEVRRGADSELLSLLDNQEKTFTIPTVVLATTNFPETLMEPLTNRPGRFDEKIEFKSPTGDARAAFLKFFAAEDCTEEALVAVKDKKYDGFTPAHLKECVIRAAINEITIVASLESIRTDIDLYKNAFKKAKSKLGLG